ncbi:MAG: glycosyltransferase family 2 protein [Gaiellaceae bacterium]
MSTGSLAEVAAPPVAERLAGLRRGVIVPAYNEEGSVARVIAEIRAFDPGLEIVVVDDGSTDETARVAREAGARVLRLPFNVGIGGAVQTGQQYARDHGFDIAIQIDGDGQHDASELPKLLGPIVRDEADLVVGTRFVGDSGYMPPKSRRLGIIILAKVVSWIVGQRVTDPTSGFRAVNRRALELFAGDYPHDYPEVEATVLVHHHHLRMVEVPVLMRERTAGSSSITMFYSAVYMGKVLVALFVGLFRRYPKEEA